MKKNSTLEEWREEMARLIGGGKPGPMEMATPENGILSLLRFHQRLFEEPAKIGLAFEVISLLRTSSHRRRNQAEQAFFRWLDPLVFEVTMKLDAEVREQADGGGLAGRVAAWLIDGFSFEGPRDHARPHRWEKSFNLLADLTQVVDTAGAVVSARAELKRKDSTAAGAAARFLQVHHQELVDLPEEIVAELWEVARGSADDASAFAALEVLWFHRETGAEEELLALAARAGDESVVRGALDLLVQAGRLYELKAMSLLNAWRDAREE